LDVRRIGEEGSKIGLEKRWQLIDRTEVAAREVATKEEESDEDKEENENDHAGNGTENGPGHILIR